ncbi:MAG TPA: hypothetical protein GX392_06550 [Clostridiales bacterium]|nr:hypothetical protein [Clostridiales bacterium]
MLHTQRVKLDRSELIAIMEEEVEMAKMRNLPIIRAFEVISDRTGLKVNTIRNYYYRYINSLSDGDSLKDGEGQTKKVRSKGKPFTAEEIEMLMTTMLKAQAEGKSVRGCANELSGGDAKLLIRYQNKYRNVIANKVGYVESLMEKMVAAGETFFNPYTKEYIINGKMSSYDNYKTQEQFNEILRDTVTSLSKIQNMTIKQLIHGLSIITKRLSGDEDLQSNETYVKMKEEQRKLEEKLSQYEQKLEDERWKSARLFTLLRQLITINKNFLALPTNTRSAEIDEYVLALKNCIDIYKVTVDEYIS